VTLQREHDVIYTKVSLLLIVQLFTFKIIESDLYGSIQSCLDSSGKELFPKRTWRIPGSIHRGNNVWPMCMSLRIGQISRPPLLSRKPVRKQKKMFSFNLI